MIFIYTLSYQIVQMPFLRERFFCGLLLFTFLLVLSKILIGWLSYCNFYGYFLAFFIVFYIFRYFVFSCKFGKFARMSYVQQCALKISKSYLCQQSYSSICRNKNLEEKLKKHVYHCIKSILVDLLEKLRGVARYRLKKLTSCVLVLLELCRP